MGLWFRVVYQGKMWLFEIRNGGHRLDVFDTIKRFDELTKQAEAMRILKRLH